MLEAKHGHEEDSYKELSSMVGTIICSQNDSMVQG